MQAALADMLAVLRALLQLLCEALHKLIQQRKLCCGGSVLVPLGEVGSRGLPPRPLGDTDISVPPP